MKKRLKPGQVQERLAAAAALDRLQLGSYQDVHYSLELLAENDLHAGGSDGLAAGGGGVLGERLLLVPPLGMALGWPLGLPRRLPRHFVAGPEPHAWCWGPRLLRRSAACPCRGPPHPIPVQRWLELEADPEEGTRQKFPDEYEEHRSALNALHDAARARHPEDYDQLAATARTRTEVCGVGRAMRPVPSLPGRTVLETECMRVWVGVLGHAVCACVSGRIARGETGGDGTLGMDGPTPVQPSHGGIQVAPPQQQVGCAGAGNVEQSPLPPPLPPLPKNNKK